MNHPLKVYHPGKGIHYVCRWWTHSEQHQLIVAPNEKAIQYAWRSAYKRYNDAKATEFYEVELVAPSALMCAKAIEYQRDADIKSFMNDVTGSIQEAVNLGLPVPVQFAPCIEWKGSRRYYDDDDDADREPDSATLKYHFDCQNCTNKFRLVDMTAEQFYNEFSAAWKEVHPPKEYTGRYKTVYSTANPAADDEIIWRASSANFGHHCSGVELVQCEVGQPPWHNAIPWGRFSDALFYFRMLRQMDVEPYNKAAQEYRTEQKKFNDEKRKLHAAQREIAERQAAEKTLAIFKRDK